MKNKFIGIMTAAVCSAALCSSAYAATSEELAAALALDISDPKITIDAKGILQIYQADLHELLETGKLTISETRDGEVSDYLADAYDKDGKFAGNFYFIYDGTNANWYIFSPAETSEYARPAVFPIDLMINQKQAETMLKASGFDTANAEYRLISTSVLGCVLYADNGTDKAFVYTGLKGGDGFELYDENSVAVVNDEFKEKAAVLLKEYDKMTSNTDSWEGEGNPPTGGGDNYPLLGVGADENPPTMGGAEENPPTAGGDDSNPITGGSFAVGKTVCVTALAALGVGAAVFKKKRGRH